MSVLVSRKAPNFTATAVMPDGRINRQFSLADYQDKYVLLFFWPMDFTFICPTEIIAHNNRLDQFKERGVEIIGVSIDSEYTHNAWRNTPVDKGGIGKIGFPMVADVNHAVVQAYGVEHADGVALRASFLIDRSGIVQYQVVNNLDLGRDVDETLRMVDALQYCEIHGEVCPAGWQKGQEGLTATTEGISFFLSKHAGEL